MPLHKSFLLHSSDIPSYSCGLGSHSSNLFIIWITVLLARNEPEFVSPKEMINEVSLNRLRVHQVIFCCSSYKSVLH